MSLLLLLSLSWLQRERSACLHPVTCLLVPSSALVLPRAWLEPRTGMATVSWALGEFQMGTARFGEPRVWGGPGLALAPVGGCQPSGPVLPCGLAPSGLSAFPGQCR